MNKGRLVPSVLSMLHTILEMGGLDAKLYFQECQGEEVIDTL